MTSTEAVLRVPTLQEAITPSRAGVEKYERKLMGKHKLGLDKAAAQSEITYQAPEPKSAAERREWDRMSTHMEGFHSYFRTHFREIYEFADKYERLAMNLRSFLRTARDLERHLHGHHTIEERFIFPLLAQRMPEFKVEHIAEHNFMHAQLDRYAAYLDGVMAEPSKYNPDDLRRIMAELGPILFYHLDAEVETLRADNLRRYYTLAEVRTLPM